MLAVFDLDYTVWQPEMYQLYSKPKFIPTPPGLSEKVLQETKTVKEGMILADSTRGSPMRVFRGAYVQQVVVFGKKVQSLTLGATID